MIIKMEELAFLIEKLALACQWEGAVEGEYPSLGFFLNLVRLNYMQWFLQEIVFSKDATRYCIPHTFNIMLKIIPGNSTTQVPSP